MQAECFVDRGVQSLVGMVGWRDSLAIQKEDRRPIDTERLAASQIGLNSLGDFRAVHVGHETSEIEVELGRVFLQLRPNISGGNPGPAISVERVVHFPKLALQCGRLRRARCVPRKFMHRERMLAEDDDELFAVIVLQFFQNRPHLRTRKTLEVAKFFDHDGRARIAAKVHRLRAGLAVIKNGTGRWRGGCG